MTVRFYFVTNMNTCRTLNEKERLLYGPMAGVGGLIYDKDAIYIQTTERQKKNEVGSILIMFSNSDLGESVRISSIFINLQQDFLLFQITNETSGR